MSTPTAASTRYTFLHQLGAGGMGAVWRAHDDLLGRDVAVKSLRHERDITQLRREARALAALRHPNVVAVHDLFLIDERPFLVMDLVDGPSVAERLTDVHTLDESEVRRIGTQMAGALSYAHEHGVCHNDVKPANVIFDAAGNAHLTDFGVAHLSGATVSTDDARAVFGTLAYMAPECLAGASPSPAADVYSLGATLFECIAGRPPFGGDASAVSQRLTRPAPPLRSFAPSASGQLERVLDRALAATPAQRYESAAEFADALSHDPEEQPTRSFAAAPSMVRPRGHARHRRDLAAVAAATLGLVLVAAAGTLWWSGDHQSSAAKTTGTAVPAAVFGAAPTATQPPATVTVAPTIQATVTGATPVPVTQPPVVIRSHGKPEKPGKHN